MSEAHEETPEEMPQAKEYDPDAPYLRVLLIISQQLAQIVKQLDRINQSIRQK